MEEHKSMWPIRRAKRHFRTFLVDKRGNATGSAMAVVSLVVSLTVGTIVSAYLIPIGVDELIAVDTTAWSDGAQSLWGILDVIIVLALFLAFITVALASAERAA